MTSELYLERSEYRCGTLYIGETGRSLRTRFGEHDGMQPLTTMLISLLVVRHFTNGNHSVSNMKIRAICPISGSNDSHKRHFIYQISSSELCFLLTFSDPVAQKVSSGRPVPHLHLPNLLACLANDFWLPANKLNKQSCLATSTFCFFFFLLSSSSAASTLLAPGFLPPFPMVTQPSSSGSDCNLFAFSFSYV